MLEHSMLVLSCSRDVFNHIFFNLHTWRIHRSQITPHCSAETQAFQTTDCFDSCMKTFWSLKSGISEHYSSFYQLSKEMCMHFQKQSAEGLQKTVLTP